MQISAAAGQFARSVNLYSFRTAHDADQRSFWKNFAATHTSALGHMLSSNDFPGHLISLSRGHSTNFLPILFPSRFAAFAFLLHDHHIGVGIVLHLHKFPLGFLFLLLAVPILFVFFFLGCLAN